MDAALVNAVMSFQGARGLEVDGVCGPGTWRTLVEAEFQLGARLLYLTRPMLRGDDVSDLQHRLGNMGFDPGRTDGIFGPDTQSAVAEFQRNAGLVVDEVCGPDTVEALERIATRGGNSSVAGLKERERYRNSSRDLIGMRIAICAMDDGDPIAGPLGSGLHLEGAEVAVFSDADGSRLAQMVNSFEADLCIGLVVTVLPTCEVAYFGVDTYTSPMGLALAELVVRHLPAHPDIAAPDAMAMRIPLLRETRAPAIRLKIGPSSTVFDATGLIAAGLQRAVDRWAHEPVPATSTST
jgi:N-acetylmuramoyl-L-alanine amidase